jgi:Ser/Thr protein kinase RdoA (MazF antagonist)
LPGALAAAPPEVVDRLRADAFTYFRFINRAWTARVCEAFADIPDPTIVRLHGDAHVEQFALTKNGWGLDDFDDSTRGPAFVDIVRFLGSIDLAVRKRGWTRDRDALRDRFFEGYRRGLAESDYRPPEPDIVRELRKRTPLTRQAYLAWGEEQMQPMDAERLKLVHSGMDQLGRLVRRGRPDLPPHYFTVIRAGWLRIGVGSAAARKVLIRIQGRSAGPADDELIEAKEVANLDGLACLEDSTTAQAIRVIDGTRQLGRLKHDILAVGPTLLIPTVADRAEHWLEWWVSSWEPSYREVRLVDLRSVEDLGDIAFDAGVQLGAGKVVSVRKQALASVATLEQRLRKETSTLVEDLLAGWRELQER